MLLPALDYLLPTLATAANRPASLWLPPQASTTAYHIDDLFHFITYVCYFFFFVITALTVYFCFKYRRSPNNHAGNAAGPTHNTVLELTWTIIPLLLVVVIFYWGFRGYVDTVVAPKNSYEIQVTAQQWAWNFSHPNGVQTSSELVVPAGRPVKFIMRSADVLHSLFISDFRVKKDVVPGRYTTAWFEAPMPTGMDSFHWLFCTEYCGTGHSNMNVKVHVLAQADFDAWLAKEAVWLDEILPEELYFMAGPKLYARCAQCHSLDGTIGTGPSWGKRDGYKGATLWERASTGETKFTDGKTLADLVGPGKESETAEQYIRQSILNPAKHLVDGYTNAMPTFQGQLDDDRATDALIGMMKHLDEFDAKGKDKQGREAARKAAAAAAAAAPK